MSDVVIKVEKLSKKYRLGEISTGTISHDLNRFWAKIRGKDDPYAMVGDVNDRTKVSNSDYVWALNDINFEVRRGEVLGIIGRNGAGKSTLLKILSKVTSPSLGSIKMKGRVGSLLEVGTGFHPELTGRENIFLNGAILGMRKWEILKKLDEIVEFSGVEKYLDTPVKRYSSGMKVRLGFAVAAHLEPDVLIVDEVLAVGDAEFQKKCIGKIKSISDERGTTTIFVSHNLSSVANLCTRAICIENGEIALNSDVKKVIGYYMDSDNSKGKIFNELNNTACVESIDIIGKDEFLDSILYSNPITVQFKIRIKEKINNVMFIFRLEDIKGNTIFVSTDQDFEESRLSNKVGQFLYKAKLQGGILKPGKYFITFSFFNKDLGVVEHYEERGLGFQVHDNVSLKALNGLYKEKAIIAPHLDWELVDAKF